MVMTAGTLLLDSKANALMLEEGQEKVRRTRSRRRRYCIMNIVALFCIFTLLAVVILKFLVTMYPSLFGATLPALCGTVPRSFTIKGNQFMKDGQPFQYISGSIHYSRLPAMYWRDRLRKMRQAGLDAVQTYVPWNFHQPLPDTEPDWSGDRNLTNFIRIAQEEGLLVLLRAGPYICAEWDFGGLPAWLLQKNASMVIRSSDPQYLRYVDAWLKELLGKMKPLLYQNGGPIVMVQLENEYGSYPTCDKKYISHLYDLGRAVLGSDIILYTTDGNSAGYLRCGAIDRRFFATVDFGTGTANNPASAFSALRKIQPTGPLVNSEYYVGWLDLWGGGHAHVPVDPILQGLRAMYKYGASVNMYMFFGGTNFAFWNGAEDPPFKPQITSYDYDAPISESGDMTWKYQRLRETIHALKGAPLLNVTTRNRTATPYGPVKMRPMCHFVSLLPKYKASAAAGQPLASMEAHGVYQGFAVYSAFVNLTAGSHKLHLPKIGDRAYIFTSDVNYQTAVYHGVLFRDGPTSYLSMTTTAGRAAFLHILVENSGHVNFNSHMFGDTKGLFGPVTLDGRTVARWQFFALEIEKNPSRLQKCNVTGKSSRGMFYGTAGKFGLWDVLSDTFIVPSSFSKGQVLMNTDRSGSLKNVGRYWMSAGPQKSLYVPHTFVKSGINLLVLFEVEGVSGTCPGGCGVTFVKKPQLGGQVTVLPRGRA